MKRSGNFIMQSVGGENLLVPTGSKVVDMNGMVILNKTASFLWEQLENDRSVNELAELLSDRFAVDYDCAIADVKSFLAHIIGMGLLER